MKTLRELFAEFPYPVWGVIPEIPVSRVVADSRQVQPGDVFVAVAGFTVDGHRFIPDALQRGAVAIVGSQQLGDLSKPYVRVENSRQALAYLSAAMHHYPGREMVMIGVTGTDGKTTTVNLIYQILLAAGIRAGMISTVNAVIGEETVDTGFHVTTPEAPEIQRYLAQMVAAGSTHCVVETTSHGWAQHRVDACEFNIGVLTNITHEHLNDHGSFENYRAAKARLFQSLAETHSKKGGDLRVAILNRDDSSFDFISNMLKDIPLQRVTSYGIHSMCDFQARSIHFEKGRTHFWVSGGGQEFLVDSPLLGLYNVSNCLAAIATTVGGLGLHYQYAQRAIAEFPGIPGRLESIHLGQDFSAIVDFAHTPNALTQVLKTIRSQKPRRIIAVFGSAGLRDRLKRRLMAEVSAELADISILTAEDPRTESLAAILDEMSSAALQKGAILERSLYVEPDRRQAIRKAVALAEPGDVVVVCGKGHEQSMCFGTTEFPWDDRLALKAAIAERLNIPGPKMPWLPEVV